MPLARFPDDGRTVDTCVTVGQVASLALWQTDYSGGLASTARLGLSGAGAK